MAGTGLRPVFALGAWVQEIMGESLSIDHGTTGWVVRNRRTRNVPNTRFDEISTVVPGMILGRWPATRIVPAYPECRAISAGSCASASMKAMRR